MKKTLAAIAVLGAFAGSAMAADVTLYGVVDTGFRYTNTKTTGEASTNTFEMKSGQHAGSRFGLKGTEDLGNGLVVGFNLENSFNSDDGALDADGRLFHREAILYVRSADFGEVAFGRTGSLDAGTGSYNLIGTAATPFGNGWSDTTNDKKIFLGKTDRLDNAVTYKSPTFAGVTVYAQASLKNNSVKKNKTTGKLDDEGQEGSSDANRYYAIGAKGAWGPAAAGLVVSTTDYARTTMNLNKDNDDALAVSAYGTYDFGITKAFVAAEYYDNGKVSTIGTTGDKTRYYDGYGVVIGAATPLVGGKLFTQIGYTDAKSIESAGVKEDDKTVYQVSVGYEYPLSKRTCLWGAAGYMQDKIDDNTTNKTTKTKTTEVLFGLTHTF